MLGSFTHVTDKRRYHGHFFFSSSSPAWARAPATPPSAFRPKRSLLDHSDVTRTWPSHPLSDLVVVGIDPDVRGAITSIRILAITRDPSGQTKNTSDLHAPPTSVLYNAPIENDAIDPGDALAWDTDVIGGEMDKDDDDDDDIPMPWEEEEEEGEAKEGRSTRRISKTRGRTEPQGSSCLLFKQRWPLLPRESRWLDDATPDDLLRLLTRWQRHGYIPMSRSSSSSSSSSIRSISSDMDTTMTTTATTATTAMSSGSPKVTTATTSTPTTSDAIARQISTWLDNPTIKSKDLQAACRARGLPGTGTKKALATRLVACDMGLVLGGGGGGSGRSGKHSGGSFPSFTTQGVLTVLGCRVEVEMTCHDMPHAEVAVGKGTRVRPDGPQIAAILDRCECVEKGDDDEDEMKNKHSNDATPHPTTDSDPRHPRHPRRRLVAFVEEPPIIPGRTGSLASYWGGLYHGLFTGILLGKGAAIYPVRPAMWKKELGLDRRAPGRGSIHVPENTEHGDGVGFGGGEGEGGSGSQKEASVVLAGQVARFMRPFVHRETHHGRAESLLIAVWGLAAVVQRHVDGLGGAGVGDTWAEDDEGDGERGRERVEVINDR